MTSIKKALAPSGILVEMRQTVDWSVRNAWLASGENGDCWSQSMRLYLKLKGAGGVRVKGTRLSDRTRCPVNPPPHYWVENKGMVFELSCGVSQIMKKEQFYEGFLVQDVEYAPYGMMFADEIPASGGLNVMGFNDTQLLMLIELCEKLA